MRIERSIVCKARNENSTEQLLKHQARLAPLYTVWREQMLAIEATDEFVPTRSDGYASV